MVFNGDECVDTTVLHSWRGWFSRRRGFLMLQQVMNVLYQKQNFSAMIFLKAQKYVSK